MKYFPLRQQLYALQVLEYQPWRYLKWWFQNFNRLRIERKKRLVWTGKARFLFTSSLFLQISLPVIIATFVTSVTALSPFLLYTLYFILFTFLALFPAPLLPLSLLLLKPYELLNRHRTIKQIQETLKKHGRLKIIGITGSYGKTSAKDILAQTLSLKYKVLATPQSYNTLFGVAGIIKEKLKAEHEIFIVEMGAYKKGEIRELCQMVPPHIGIITGLTSQHLERFGSLENIAAAKYELIEALPPDGLAVLNLDSPTLLPLYQKTKITKIGYSQNNPQADICSKNNVTMKPFNSFQQTFNLRISSSQFPNFQPLASSFQLNLPGQHQVSNALAAIAVALYLGLTPEEVRLGLSKVQPPSHRLQILPGANGSVVIDDAYSSNPEGVKAAISFVGQLPNQPKIIVTPGLVELGSRQVEENVNFGRLIAANFDYAVIVNQTNRGALLHGLKEEGWNIPTTMKQCNNVTINQQYNNLANHQVFITDTFEEATRSIIPTLISPGCLILFENDLPDIYS